jgi:hypothetical protein
MTWAQPRNARLADVRKALWWGSVEDALTEGLIEWRGSPFEDESSCVVHGPALSVSYEDFSGEYSGTYKLTIDNGIECAVGVQIGGMAPSSDWLVYSFLADFFKLCADRSMELVNCFECGELADRWREDGLPLCEGHDPNLSASSKRIWRE